MLWRNETNLIIVTRYLKYWNIPFHARMDNNDNNNL
jgi:hypothetical protein